MAEDEAIEQMREETATFVAAMMSGVTQEADGGPLRVLALDPNDRVRFVHDYYRHAEADRQQADLKVEIHILAEHASLGAVRSSGALKLRVLTPDQRRDGWSVAGSTLVLLVTDDQPAIVDTLILALTDLGWAIRDVVHPQLQVRRDRTGRLMGVAGPDGEDVLAESWVCLRVYPPLGESADQASAPLTRRITSSLTELALINADAGLMRAQALRSAQQLSSTDGQGEPAERAHVSAVLRWLTEGNFDFLGYRRFAVGLSGDGTQIFSPVAETGLGVLRDDEAAATGFHATQEKTPTPGLAKPELLVVTRDSRRADVIRSGYRDYLGLRTYDPQGRLLSEERFLGLFTASATTESVARMPLLSRKAAEVQRLVGYPAESHGGHAARAVLESLPRAELFEASPDELAALVSQIIGLQERRRVRVFRRQERWGRFLSFLIYLPRDRYTPAARARVEQALKQTLQPVDLDYQISVNESVLARLYFTARVLPERLAQAKMDASTLEAQLVVAVQSWDDEFTQLAAELDSAERGIEFPDGYKEDYPASTGLIDLGVLNRLIAGGDELAMRLTVSALDDVDFRLKIYTQGRRLDLSQVMPHFAGLGVDVRDERPYELTLRGQAVMIYDFGLRLPTSAARRQDWSRAAKNRFTDALHASMDGRTDADGFNRLVTDTGADWREVAMLRAVARYLRQAGAPYSQTYIADTLVANEEIVGRLIRLFHLKFDPDLYPGGLDERQRASEQEAATISAALDQVPSLDHDRILRSFLAVLQSAVRTNFWVPQTDALAMKLRPGELDFLPEPRPMYEIFVCSPRVEGVHLRFGKVARGGIRWSDRAEDYRTEILSLAKAQMVKNAVIVPVGAKGGFYPRRLAGLNAAQRAQEGLGSYRVFISSLLSVTDNVIAGDVVRPARVICHDDSDPYLVVAADKGTAEFSDTANEIAQASGFWLGDAFASGGSVGYDHKQMGITARGAWESVKRHFRELDIDCQQTDFTCVGIGDMSGDVFGNGMLLSQHIRLVAAFNHQHIFLDPDPDAETSFLERRRLFELPRSSWTDYDESLISPGGGVFPRSAKWVPISPQVRVALGIEESVNRLTPAELMHAILQAPVDLLWNGGIGTYVKASWETHAQVGDRANDAIRVNADQLRCRIVGEGGNLGCTQFGRIQFAQAGGHINTDFIDNSAGVDTSDHEVNIKILLDAEVSAGRLSREDRDHLLPQMTDSVAGLVLGHNISQNLALANAVAEAPAYAGLHEEQMSFLEVAGYLDRDLECLPSTAEMQRRMARGEGLCGPELCTLLAWTKIQLEDAMLASSLPDDPYLVTRLVDYFPALLRDRYREQMLRHPLRREIIATEAVNRFVDSQGVSAALQLSRESGRPVDEVIRAQLAARNIFNAGPLEVATRRSELPARTQTMLRLGLRHLVQRATRWLLHNESAGFDISALAGTYKPHVMRLWSQLPEHLTAAERSEYQAIRDELDRQSVGEELARFGAGWGRAHEALPITRTAFVTGRDLGLVASVHFLLSDRQGMDAMMRSTRQLPRDDRWATMARAAVRDELEAIRMTLVRQALDGAPTLTRAEDIVEAWFTATSQASAVAAELAELTAGPVDLARASVGLRALRGLVG